MPRKNLLIASKLSILWYHSLDLQFYNQQLAALMKLNDNLIFSLDFSCREILFH